jgi:hypothetical protein
MEAKLEGLYRKGQNEIENLSQYRDDCNWDQQGGAVLVVQIKIVGN